MKKRLVTALALMFGLGVGATAFAAANPFVDVPAKHWAYDAVNKLAKAGIVDGYGDGTFRGDRTMTRYEMAQIVAKAMARSDKADAETKATIDKLATEFSAEIENLGVRVAKLEKKSDNVRFDGNLRVRYINDAVSPNTSVASTKVEQARYRLGATAEVNDAWSVRALFQGTADISNSSTANDTTVRLAEGYAKGKLGQADVTLGRWMHTSAGDVIFDEDSINGIKIGFGNQLKANVYYGVIAPSEVATSSTDRILGTELTWAASKNFNMFGSYNQIKTRTENGTMLLNTVSDTGKNSINLYEVGAAYKFSPDWKVTAIYNKSNANADSSGYKFDFQYKAFDLQKPGTWQANVGYWKTGLNSVYDSGAYTGRVGNASAGYDGLKGWYVDGSYVPAKNIKLRTMYADYKGTTVNGVKDKMYRAQVEFFF
ncbi:S-layer homology domain-containing protein [Anaeroarcus burkinensis]|uniref:S-layer homology domain-containing protein n=1 Tax=Anaeroarcus burkinensis TaxID=82376 RepID=UPI00040C14CC|nr:S-layer homology domain-containing protein [Anaeroarcus burkinensis]